MGGWSRVDALRGRAIGRELTEVGGKQGWDEYERGFWGQIFASGELLIMAIGEASGRGRKKRAGGYL